MKRTPLVLRGAIFRRGFMIEAGDMAGRNINQIKSEVIVYDPEGNKALIWHHPSARFVELKPGESVIYTRKDGREARYVQS